MSLRVAVAAIVLGTLAAGMTSACGPDDSGVIAFESVRPGRWHIYTMQPAGTEQTRITKGTADNASPDISPDGTRILWNRTAVDEPVQSDLYVMGIDGENMVQLTNTPGDEFEASWSHDGSHVAFVRAELGEDEENTRLYVIGADGSDERRVTTNDAREDQPDWSPDGRKIAFTGWVMGPIPDIYVIGSDGSEQQRLTDTRHSEAYPTWSPDGTLIAFLSNRDGPWEIYTMRPDGTGQEAMTSGSEASLWQIAWSPDGRYIAFTSTRDGNSNIYLVSVDGGEGDVRLTTDGAADISPSWAATSAVE